ncbi:MAG: hypothetical protein M3506_05820 [Chloroflexota bacterium]|nr:hypothetical protein [Chloroflexota bacterium]
MQPVMFDRDDTRVDHQQSSAAALTQRPRDLGAREYHRLLDEAWTRIIAGKRTSEATHAERFRRLALWRGEEISLAQA